METLVNDLVARYRKVDEEFFEELEEILIGADVGFDTVMELIDELKLEVKRKNIQDTEDVQSVISEKLVEIYQGDREEDSTLNIQNDQVWVMLAGPSPALHPTGGLNDVVAARFK